MSQRTSRINASVSISMEFSTMTISGWSTVRVIVISPLGGGADALDVTANGEKQSLAFTDIVFK